MKSKSWKIVFAGGLLLLAAAGAQAKDSGPITVALKYTPQESVGSSSVMLAPGLGDRPVVLSLADGRPGADPAVIGENANDDEVRPMRASNDPVAWANEVLRKNAADWGVKTAEKAPLTLAGKLVRLRALESRKAVGSTYTAEVQVSFALKDARGATLWEGAVAGDATRYGRKLSEENVNEVLSDATKQAYANLFNNAGLQDAWAGKGKPVATAGTAAAAPAAAPAAPPVSPADLLADLVKLKKQGFSTDLLVDYVNQKSLSKTLSADDMGKWKAAGMPDEVLKAALAKGKS
ncbi:MAG TPA: hypothetical protein VLX28_04720 [Thermoanaerobaculia bacterium]|nr:hypothetical protein [Thermoanaerobaculia bacterium]